jgi:tetratricopeptide (TPR) repeat protein
MLPKALICREHKMTVETPNRLLEAHFQQHEPSLAAILAQQNKVLGQMARQQDELYMLLRAQQSQSAKSQKDIWDRLMAVAPIFSAIIIACTGAYFTYSYNQQQIKLQEAQTIEKFFPHLVGDEKTKRAAILAMNSLGNTKLAAKVASVFASEGTASALSSMAKSSATEDKAAVRDALYKTLDALAEKYHYENKFDDAVETYKKALTLKQSVVGKDSPELADNLEKLAALYEEHGDKAAADELLRRSAALRKQANVDVPPAAAGGDDAKSNSSEARKAAKADDGRKPGKPEASNDLQWLNMDPVPPDEHDPRPNAHASVEQ